MIPYMPHSGKRGHVWRLRSAWYRQYLISHGWGLRGAYASKFFGGEEYMMTRVSESNGITTVFIRPKSDFWAKISKKHRDKDARETRREIRTANMPEKN